MTAEYSPPQSPAGGPAAPAAAATSAAAALPRPSLRQRFDCRLTSLRGFKRQAAACGLGALMALALPPFYLLPLMLFSLPCFTRLLDSLAGQQRAGLLSRRRAAMLAALTGWSFGFGYFTAGLWWLADAMTVDLSQFGWAIPFAVFGLPAFLALYYGLAAGLAFLAWRPGLSRLLALAAAFALGEYWRGVLFTGFPWNAISLTAMPCPLLMQADGLLGQNAMNGLTVFVFSLPALWLGLPPRRAAAAAAANLPNPAAGFNRRAAARAGLILGLILIAADLGYGFYALRAPALPPAAKLHLRLVQPGIAQQDKQGQDAAARAAAFRRLLELTKAPPAAGQPAPDIIIWPETAVPYLLDYDPEALAAIGAALQPGQLLLAGAVRVEPLSAAERQAATEAAGVSADAESAPLTDRYRFYNSMLLINAKGQIIAHADKVHLVPFGEYLPFARLARKFGLSALADSAGPYSAAPARRLLPLPQGLSALPLICYEAIFPAEAQSPAGAKASILVNITNDAWFGATPGPYQHLAQARLRAIEQRRPLIRAANTGISAYIDAKGRIKAAMPLNKSGFLDFSLTQAAE